MGGLFLISCCLCPAVLFCVPVLFYFGAGFDLPRAFWPVFVFPGCVLVAVCCVLAAFLPPPFERGALCLRWCRRAALISFVD